MAIQTQNSPTIRGEQPTYWKIICFTTDTKLNTTNVALYDWASQDDRINYLTEPLDTRNITMQGIFEDRASIYQELENATNGTNDDGTPKGTYEFYGASDVLEADTEQAWSDRLQMLSEATTQRLQTVTIQPDPVIINPVEKLQ